MAANFQKLRGKIKPYLKLGHDKSQALLQRDGYPAAGWIDNVRAVGSTLKADILSVPKKIANLISAKAYGRFSPEIYWNARIGEQRYGKVLSAVSLLGADTPANLTLDDFINLYSHSVDIEAELKTYHEPEPGTNNEKEGDSMDNGIDPKEYARLEMKAGKVDELEKQLSDLQGQVKEYKKLEEENASLKQKVESSEKSAAEAEEKAYSEKVNAVWKELNGKKLLPKHESIFRALAYSDRAKVKEYSVDGKTVQYSSALDLLSELGKELPDLNIEGEQTQYSEIDRTDKSADPLDGDGKDLDAKIKKYSQEHKVSYADAYAAIAAGEE